MNRRMDEEEINRATEKLKTDFKEEIKAVTMSSFLSDETLRRKKIDQTEKTNKY